MLNRTLVSGTTLGAGLALLMTTTAQAALVSSSSEVYSAAAVSTDGTLVGAFNANATTGVGTIFETITWENLSAAEALAGPITLGPGTASIFAEGVGADILTGSPGVAGGIRTDSLFRNPGNNGLLTFSGLDDGDYLFQVVLSDIRDFNLPPNNLHVYFDQTDATGTPDAEINVENAGGLVTANFTISGGADQNIYLVQSTNLGDFDGSFSAFQVRLVPEPGSLALLGLGGLALLRRRRA